MKVSLQRSASRAFLPPLKPHVAPSTKQPQKVHWQTRTFKTASKRDVIKPFLLADIGEGIREVQIIQWYVQPGATVEQFQPLCEVQSDKAVTDITSRFDGVIKKLHWESDDMVQVGKPLVDIDIQGDISPEDEAVTKPDTPSPSEASETPTQAESTRETTSNQEKLSAQTQSSLRPSHQSSSHASLATPAVRHLIKELDVKIAEIEGTGRDGRVLKEDVHRFVSSRESISASSKTSTFMPAPVAMAEDRMVPLTPIQNQMFKTMTRSLAIPHFLYTDAIDMTRLTNLRRSLLSSSSPRKLSSLAFILKAVSLSLHQFPILNSSLDTATNSSKPQILLRADHNLGIAVDTPTGLIVPVVKRVQSLSIAEIAAEISRLGAVGREGKLTNADLSGGTLTVSNVGSIGGGVVSPVIIEGQAAIIGVGKAKAVPAFGENGEIIRREECVMSWSADHRIIDGATAARCAEKVKKLLESPADMVVDLR